MQWWLANERHVSHYVAARLLGIAADTVKDGAARHAARIDEFRATAGAKL